MKKYAISDIHGCVKTFHQLLDKIAYCKTDELYVLGDLVDRGPDSKGVLDLVMNLQKDGYDVKCLRGNHEQMLLDAVADTAAYMHWIRYGGKETLDSFETTRPEYFEAEYLHFMDNLPYYYEVDEYLLVHAGLNFIFGEPLKYQDSMLWERNWYNRINYEWLGDRFVVHGHTPIEKKKFEKQWSNFDKKRYLDIDLGCTFLGKNHHEMNLGLLCAFNLTDRSYILQENVENPAVVVLS